MTVVTARVSEEDALALQRIKLARREDSKVFCSVQSLIHEAVALLVAQERAK
jgi:hypothetical protein